MAELVTAAVVSAAFNDLYAVVKNAVSLVVWCHRDCQKLQDDLEKYQPLLEHICSNLSTPPSAWEKRFLLDFSQKLKDGRLLVDSCVQRGWANFFRRLRYSLKFPKLRKDILQHLQKLPGLNTLQLQQIKASHQALREELGRNHDEVISALKSGTAPGADVNINKQSDQTRLVDAGVQVQEDQTFLIGLDSHIEQVTSLLKDKKKSVVILNGMGGIGKTTLALAICKDDKVKDVFKGGVHFFVVSQLPDMKGVLSTIWKTVVGGQQAPFFQTEEDAHRQLTTKLRSIMSSQGHEILLVLDDVWSQVALEKLSFGVTGLKTMITTRQAAKFHARHSHTYNLSMLNETGAKSLFCYYAFGEYSIPDWIGEPLRPVVHEVIKECQGLPLALKVIGTSLLSSRDNPLALEYWRLTRDRLQKAGPLEEDHKDALFGRLQTSVDALDDFLQECFIDLAVFPEDSECSADILLDIWVYVRGKEWEEAVLALAELGNRCLLSFKNGNITSADIGRAVECKSACKLVFTQHDVLRGLAVQLAVKDESKSRLLMPAMINILSNSRQPENSVVARVISIHTGPNFLHSAADVMKQIEPLAFPHAEALLLDATQLEESGLGTRLRPLISRMGPTLKVLFIRVLSHNSEWSFMPKDGMLTDFNELRSMDTNLQNGVIISPKLEKLRFNLRRSEICHIKELPASLEILSLQDCLGLEKLPQDFGRLENLRELVLRGFRGEELPGSFEQLRHLRRLDLSSCRDIKRLPDSIGELRCLQYLSLQLCHGLLDLPESFGQLGCLQYLSVKYCHGLKYLPESFGQLGCLQHLNMAYCHVLEYLPESFGQLGRLQHLSLLFCSGLKCLPESFGELGCLQHLDMEGCNGLKYLLESFGQLGCLEHLNIACCHGL